MSRSFRNRSPWPNQAAERTRLRKPGAIAAGDAEGAGAATVLRELSHHRYLRQAGPPVKLGRRKLQRILPNR